VSALSECQVAQLLRNAGFPARLVTQFSSFFDFYLYFVFAQCYSHDGLYRQVWVWFLMLRNKSQYWRNWSNFLFLYNFFVFFCKQSILICDTSLRITVFSKSTPTGGALVVRNQSTLRLFVIEWSSLRRPDSCFSTQIQRLSRNLSIVVWLSSQQYSFSDSMNQTRFHFSNSKNQIKEHEEKVFQNRLVVQRLDKIFCITVANCALIVYHQQGFNGWYGYRKHKSECDHYHINCWANIWLFKFFAFSLISLITSKLFVLNEGNKGFRFLIPDLSSLT
jgi:hypothetical protein